MFCVLGDGRLPLAVHPYTVDSKKETKANKILLERSLAPAGVCFLLLSFTLTKTPVLALRFAGELPLATFVGEM